MQVLACIEPYLLNLFCKFYFNSKTVLCMVRQCCTKMVLWKVIGNIYDGCIGCFSYILLLRIWPKKRPMSSDIIQVLFKQHCSLDRFIQKRSNRNYMLNNIASFPHTMFVYYETRSTRIPYCLYSIHLFTTLCTCYYPPPPDGLVRTQHCCDAIPLVLSEVHLYSIRTQKNYLDTTLSTC